MQRYRKRPFDVICFTETWADGQTNFKKVFGKNYKVFAKNRCSDNSAKKRGGGVVIAVSKTLRSELVDIPGCKELEQVLVKIEDQGKTTFVVCLYLPPDRSTKISSP